MRRVQCNGEDNSIAAMVRGAVEGAHACLPAYTSSVHPRSTVVIRTDACKVACCTSSVTFW